jgi:uncharacterized membrane protein YgcG
MARLLSLPCLLLLAPSLGASRAWLASELPSPDRDPAACGRPARSFLCDPDRLLSDAGAKSLEHLLTALHQGARPDDGFSGAQPRFPDAPSCAAAPPRGYALAVAVVRSAGGAGSDSLRAERLARGLHDSWGVGDACGSGALLLVAVEDRELFLSTGRSASQHLSDAAAELAFERMRPLLRAGDLDGSLLAGATALSEVLAGRLHASSALWPFLVILALVLLFAAHSAWAARRSRQSYALAVRRLTALEADAARAKAQRYAATSCPICMEDFELDSQSDKQKEKAKERERAEARPRSSSPHHPGASPAFSPSPGLQKELLRCGHAFCAACLARALATKASCPVCRAPTDGSETPRPRTPGSAAPPNSNTNSNTFAPGCSAEPPAGDAFDVHAPELLFRLRRLRQLHPQIVTHGMVDRWAAGLREGGWASDAAFVRANPANGGGPGGGGGGGGEPPRFGGGSSAGGGGRGGSW